jgi:hypothetical protein
MEAPAAAAYTKRLKATVEARTRARARMMRCLFISVSFLLGFWRVRWLSPYEF